MRIGYLSKTIVCFFFRPGPSVLLIGCATGFEMVCQKGRLNKKTSIIRNTLKIRIVRKAPFR